jgi:hypothetical protein
MLNELSKQIYEGNKLRGFDVSKENIGQTLMLVVSELAEALEADRKAKYSNLEIFENCMSLLVNLFSFGDKFRDFFLNVPQIEMFR